MNKVGNLANPQRTFPASMTVRPSEILIAGCVPLLDGRSMEILSVVHPDVSVGPVEKLLILVQSVLEQC
ncbi:MAG: hypothetical protein WAW06_07990, partial [bacterium]